MGWQTDACRRQPPPGRASVDFDRIAVLERGRIVAAIGRTQTLLAGCAAYCDLWRAVRQKLIT